MLASVRGGLRGVNNKEDNVLRGIATVSFFADDLEAARRWYTELLGVEPYFVRPLPPAPPAYIEFRTGDYLDELGIIDCRYAPHGSAGGPAGAVVFWHVDDLPAALDRLLSMGATQHEALTEREAGFVTASVFDPFGNILGVMYNPHYLEVLASTRRA
jgi:catechol 2,3-dioxygenase-like lactoylglutathione lyase family enzyme